MVSFGYDIIYYMASEPLKKGDFVMIDMPNIDEVRLRKRGESPALRVANDLVKEEFKTGELVPCQPLYDLNHRLIYTITLDGITYYMGTHIEEIEVVKDREIITTTIVKEYTGKLKDV